MSKSKRLQDGGILKLPAEQQKKMYEKAAKESIKRQLEIIKKYEQVFGEKLENSR